MKTNGVASPFLRNATRWRSLSLRRTENRVITPPECDRPLARSFWAMPALNRGYAHYLELSAGMQLNLWQEAYFEDTEIRCETRSHPWVEFSFLLKGSHRLDTGMVLKAQYSWLCARKYFS